MKEEIKKLLPSPMRNYVEIAERVSVLRQKQIGERTVMYYLQGKDVSISEGTGQLIEEVALDLISGNALQSLKIVDEIKAARIAA